MEGRGTWLKLTNTSRRPEIACEESSLRHDGSVSVHEHEATALIAFMLFFPLSSPQHQSLMRAAIFALSSLALLITSLAAQNVAITPSDVGVRIDVDGKLFTEYQTKDVPRPF